jgi:hypothetical protein
MSFMAVAEEIQAADARAAGQHERDALARLDGLVEKLEELNLREIRQVPLQLHFEIARALDGLLSQGLGVPDSPSRALETVFAGQAAILRGLYPEWQDEFDDE